MVSPRTQPKRIIDTNGHEKTVHALPDGANAKNVARIASVPAPPQGEPRPYIDLAPTEVDGEISRIYQEINTIDMRLKGTKEHIAREERNAERLQERGIDPTYRLNDLQRYRDMIPPLEEKMDELDAEARVYQREYVLRGKWERYYEVTNSNGHVHSSMSCSTCFPTTQYYWHTDKSGVSADDLVNEAGESACTVCFPNAPVEALQRPKSLETPDNKAKREAREERALKAAEKAKKAEAAGIALPDGNPLRDSHNFIIKTERMAEQGAVDNVLWLHAFGVSPDNSNIPKYQQSLDDAIDALAHKRGQTKQEVRELIIEKGRAKLKRERATSADIADFVDRATKSLLP